MFHVRRYFFWPALLVIALLTSRFAAATEAGKLLPADPDMIVTLNVRQFLDDHQKTPLVQKYLDQWFHVVQKEAIGFDLAHDIDRVTCGVKVGDGNYVVVLVEGTFQHDKMTAAIKHLAQKQGSPIKAVKAGGLDAWEVGTDGAHVVLLNGKMLAVTSDRKTLDDLLARNLGPKNDGLPKALQALLGKQEKAHAALAVRRVDVVVDDAVRLLKEEITRQWKIKDGLSKYVVDQLTAGLQKYGKETLAAGMALTAGAEELKLRVDLEMKSAKMAKELRGVINSGNWWTALALKAVDNELTQQLADVVLKTRVVAKDTSVSIQAELPYSLVQDALRASPLGNLLPADPKNAKPAPSGLTHTVAELLSRQVTSLRLWGPLQPAPGALEVEERLDIPYYTGPDADYIRHRLDLFVPKGKKDFPVVVLVHGGGWTLGDNRCCGLYTTVGQFLASQGVGAVLPNYRLSPWVKHPDHVKDVARAVAWTQAHIAQFGGDPQRLFLLGHSAGGHLVSLLATDETYLKTEGLKSEYIKGVISVGGVYHITPGGVELGVGGNGPKAVGVDQMMPVRGPSGFSFNLPFSGLPMTVDVFGPVFGDDPKARADASPLNHVRPGLPPFLIIHAGRDLPTLPPTASEFHKALLAAKCDAQLLKIAHRNHDSQMFSAIIPSDPVAKAILEFLQNK